MDQKPRPQRTALRLLLSLAFAASATFLAHHFDGQRARTHVSELGLRAARQVAAQVEALYLEARQNEQADPLGHAIYLFSQSPEPRLAEVKRLDTPIPGDEETEQAGFDSARGIFEYSKMFGASEGLPDGVKVRVLAWRTGFLGARTTLQNDLTLALVFLLSFCTGLFALKFRARKVVEIQRIEVPVPTPQPGLTTRAPQASRTRKSGSRSNPRAAFAERFGQWKNSVRTALLQTGNEVREVVRTAHQLTSAAQISLEKLVQVQGKLRSELTALHGARQSAEMLARAIAECEGKPEKLAQLAPQLRQLAERNSQSLRSLERQVEPWSMEVDLAVQSFDDFALASDRMRSHIRKTTELMLDQARLIKELPLEPATSQEPKSTSSGQTTRTIA